MVRITRSDSQRARVNIPVADRARQVRTIHYPEIVGGQPDALPIDSMQLMAEAVHMVEPVTDSMSYA
jgi:hypothetical protein